MAQNEKLEIRKAADGQHHYVVKVGKNGEDLWTSEMFTRKATAKEAALRERGVDAGIAIVDTTGSEATD